MQVTKYTKLMQSLLIVSLFILTGFLSYVFLIEREELKQVEYKLLQERELGDGTENSLYRIFDGEKYFFLATNKILDKQKLKNLKNGEVDYLGSDIFWNPERCAQMKSFYTKDRVYFFDTTVGNPEENNGDSFVSLLHIYDLRKNTLSTYKLSKYLNLAEIDKLSLEKSWLSEKKDIKAEHIAKMYFRDKDNMIYLGYFDMKELKVNFECEDKKCYHNDVGERYKDKDLYALGYSKSTNIYNLRPYIFQIRNKFTQNIILNLKEEEQIYSFVIGY